MHFLIRFSRFLPPLLFILTGLGIALAGSRYRVGTLTAMGPGFMPLLLGMTLAGLGVLILWLTLRHPDAPVAAESAIPLRPVLCAGGGLIIWALLVEVVGFFPASMAQLLLSVLALPQQKWPRVLAGSAVFCAAVYGIFVLILGLPLPAFNF